VARFGSADRVRPTFLEVRETPRTAKSQLDLITAMVRLARTKATRAIGIAIAAPVRPSDGRVLRGGILDLGDIELAELIQKALKVPAWVANDARAAALGEGKLGAARGFATAVTLTIGSGIGGGITDQGCLRVGNGLAGEFGHMAVFENAGACGCGATSCWELRASGSALREMLGGCEVSSVDSATVEQKVVLQSWAGDLLRGLWSIQCTVDPDMFVLGGGAGHLAADVLERFDPDMARTLGRLSPIRAATFGEQAGIIGAAELARTGYEAILVSKGGDG